MSKLRKRTCENSGYNYFEINGKLVPKKAYEYAENLETQLKVECERLRELVIECIESFEDMSPDWAESKRVKLQQIKTMKGLPR